MENNEDEPDDVKKATPVESAILDGNKDEKKQSIKGKNPKSTPGSFNDREVSRVKKCNLYNGKFPPQVSKTKKKPCHPKAEIICRENLSKDEYIDVLSTPKKSRGLSCKLPKFESTDSSNKRFAAGRKPSCKEKTTLPQPLSRRIEELAKPKPTHIMDLLQTWGSRLRPEIIDSVKKSLEENCTMSPEQMEAYYNEQEREECSRVRRVRRKKCPGEKEKKKSPCDGRHMDPQAVCEEYEMAQRFMRHIISHLKNCPFAPEDHYDLTEVILSQLGNVLDYRPSGDGDRKFQMMFMLANGIACWVHGLNATVAEKIAKQQTEDAKEGMGTGESGDEDDEEGEDEEEQKEEVAEVTQEDEEEEEGAEEEKGDESGDEGEIKDEKDEKWKEEQEEENDDMKGEPNDDEANHGAEDGFDDGSEVAPQSEEDTEDTDIVGGSNVEMENEGEEIAKEGEGEDEISGLIGEPQDIAAEIEISEMEEQEREVVETAESEEEIASKDDEETPEDVPWTRSEAVIDPGLAIQGLGEGDLFASEIPFITFGKIMEIVVRFLEKFEEAETSEVRRRLQNAILRKLTNLILAEAPDSLDNNMKAVLEVLAENIAVFMEDTLPSSKVQDVQTMTPVIESTEVRNWGHWLETVMDNATNWGKWIHEKVGEAEEKARTKVTRGDWQDWTNTVNSEALRWRMFNLDTKHRMHHEDLNLTHKKVVHRGGMRNENVMGSAKLAPAYPEKDETEMNAYDFSTDAKSLDQNEENITE